MKIFADYHTHTIYSHGKGTIRENVESAIKEEIDELNKEYSQIKILLGVEANIISYKGDIDVNENILKYIDMLLVGFHFGARLKSIGDVYNMFVLNYLGRYSKSIANKAKHTDALINAINRYDIDIITHPGAKVDIDAKRLAQAAAKRGTVLEINASHGQLSLDYIKMAMTEEVKFVISSDAHCMDNLPPVLLPKFAQLYYESKRTAQKVAIVVDIRGGEFFDDLFKSLALLERRGYKYKILFLDTVDEVLIKRYKEHRRPHPLSPDGRIIDGITLERKKLAEVKEKANYVIDTTSFTLGMLKEEITGIFVEGKETNKELREYTGNDKQVRDYVMGWEQTKTFVEKLEDMLDFLIPFYIKEGKTQLVIGIGCTGGKHRSVTIANVLYETLVEKEHRVILNHRDSKK